MRKPTKKADIITQYRAKFNHRWGVTEKRQRNTTNKFRYNSNNNGKTFDDVMTRKSQGDLANALELVMSSNLVKLPKPSYNMFNNHLYKSNQLTKLREIIRKQKTIKKDQNANIDELLWIAHKYILALVKDAIQANQNTARAERNARQKARTNAEIKRKTNAKTKRNKALQNKLDLLNNNARKALKNAEVEIKQLVKDLSAIKRKDKKEYKKLDALNPKLSKFYKLNRNEGLTGNERQAYKKLQKEHDDIINTLKKQVEVTRAKERLLFGSRLLKDKLLKNANIAQKQIKGIAKGAIQKAIAANKVRVKRAAENAKSVANIAKSQAKINGFQKNIKNLGNINTFDKKIKKAKLLFKINEYKRDQLSEQIAPFRRNIRNEFGLKATYNVYNAMYGQERFINVLKRKNLITFDKIKNKFGNTFMNNMDKIAARRKKLVKELNVNQNEIEKLKQEKEVNNKKAKNNKFLGNLDAKAAANMKKQANADIGILRIDSEIDAMTDELKLANKAVKKKLRELQKLQAKLRKKHGFGYYAILVASNTEESKLIVETLKDLNKQWDQLKNDVQSLEERIPKAKKERKALRKKRKISPTKMFYLYQIGDMLDDEGLYSKEIMLSLNRYLKDNLKEYYGRLRELIEHKYFKIPEFKNRAKNLMNKNNHLQIGFQMFTTTLENRVRILNSNILSENAKGYALRASTYDVSRKGDVKKIMDLKIPPYWKAKLLLKAQVWEDFLSIADLNLITPNVSNSFGRIKQVLEAHRRRLERGSKINIAIAKLKPAIMSYKVRQNKKKLNTGVGNVVTNESFAKVINKVTANITKKQKNVEKLRKNYATLKTRANSPKLKLIKNEISRRDKEIRNLVKNLNKYNKFVKVNKPIRQTAATKITKRALGFLTRKGIKNSAEQKKVINRFLGKLAINTRPTLKQKYRLFTDLMKPDSELNFLSETGNGYLLERALYKRKMACHVANKNARFVRAYIPGLRESLYTLASQYFEQHDELNNANDRRNFHKKFLNRLEGASAFPCLEGSITALTTTVIDPGLNWRGHYGLEKKEMHKDVNGIEREVVVKVPINFNKVKHIQNLRDIVFGTKLGTYYGTLKRTEKEHYRGLTTKEQLQYMWDKFKDLELSHGRHLTAIGEIMGINGKRTREAFVESFKLYGNAIYNNDTNYTNAELNAQNQAFSNLKVNDLNN